MKYFLFTLVFLFALLALFAFLFLIYLVFKQGTQGAYWTGGVLSSILIMGVSEAIKHTVNFLKK